MKSVQELTDRIRAEGVSLLGSPIAILPGSPVNLGVDPAVSGSLQVSSSTV